MATAVTQTTIGRAPQRRSSQMASRPTDPMNPVTRTAATTAIHGSCVTVIASADTTVAAIQPSMSQRVAKMPCAADHPDGAHPPSSRIDDPVRTVARARCGRRHPAMRSAHGPDLDATGVPAGRRKRHRQLEREAAVDQGGSAQGDGATEEAAGGLEARGAIAARISELRTG